MPTLVDLERRHLVEDDRLRQLIGERVRALLSSPSGLFRSFLLPCEEPAEEAAGALQLFRRLFGFVVAVFLVLRLGLGLRLFRRAPPALLSSAS
jgi:hypothetical protein